MVGRGDSDFSTCQDRRPQSNNLPLEKRAEREGKERQGGRRREGTAGKGAPVVLLGANSWDGRGKGNKQHQQPKSEARETSLSYEAKTNAKETRNKGKREVTDPRRKGRRQLPKKTGQGGTD